MAELSEYRRRSVSTRTTVATETTNIEYGADRDTGELVSDSAGYREPPPPADRGKDAYLFLTACFILEALVWGRNPSSLVNMPASIDIDTMSQGCPSLTVSSKTTIVLTSHSKALATLLLSEHALWWEFPCPYRQRY
jgi:hypothetical protein